MKSIVDSYGVPSSRFRKPGFQSLLKIIIGQQVSVSAGESIWKNFNTQIIDVSPRKILKLSPAHLRKCGLSRQKVDYIYSLSNCLIDGSLDLDSLSVMSDADAISQLTRVKGIGEWTAQIYLMFSLARKDIWPNGDLALSNSVKLLFRLDHRPKGEKLLEIAEQWKPRRTAASLLLWHYYHNVV